MLIAIVAVALFVLQFFWIWSVFATGADSFHSSEINITNFLLFIVGPALNSFIFGFAAYGLLKYLNGA